MITVGVPTYNEEKIIGSSILSIISQIKKDDEIIVVASGCTDGTEDAVKKLMKEHSQVKLITEPERRGKASALNIILKEAKGEIIVQTDGDVILEKGAINFLLTPFKDEKIGAVSGNPVPELPNNNLFYDWTLMSYRKAHELRLKETEEGKFWHLSGYLCAYRKSAMDEIPLDTKGAVDGVMGRLVISKGYKLTYSPDAKVIVRCPTTIKDFINQKARVRTGFYLLEKRFGKIPRTMKSELLYFPKELVKLPVKRWPAFVASAGIYTYTWLKGKWLAKTNAPLAKVWKTIDSTK